MTTNSPNPVDGDVQAHQMPSMTDSERQKNIDAISTRMRSIVEEGDENLQFEYDILRFAMVALTTQPAQLLRPVELPFKRDLRDERENGFLERAIGWNECIDEVQRLNATAQPVSDGCKVPEGWKLVPIELTEGMIAAWREDMGRSYAGFYARKIGDDEIQFAHQAMLKAAPGGQDE